MQCDPACPVCNGKDWKTIGIRTYRMADYKKVTPYIRKRLEVLFQIWNKGEKKEVTLSSILCQQCGFVCYTPRPENEDISRKYEFLSKDETTKNEISLDLDSDMERSNDLFRHMRPYVRPNMSVLDFGGGTGRLMQAFLERKHECSLIDYPGKKLPGVKYLGNQLTDIETACNFDLIVCSHVLEHLADPYSVVLSLRSYLAHDGTLYIEVPLEIWKKAPLPVEPVTHINYFTVDSLRILLERAGLDVLSCKDGTYINENGKPGLAIRAYAKQAGAIRSNIHHPHAADATLSLLNPSPAQQIARAVKFPAITRANAKRTLSNMIGRTPLLWRMLSR
ncbi:MAG: class I SAM-dependent methyltransferase [Thiobacillus sp.]|nr:class I SAM-dependent methyltransferase [Thiobacillus sp.]